MVIVRVTRVLIGVLAVTGLATQPGIAADKVLNVLSYGGPWNEVQEQNVVERFEKETGYKVVLGSQPVNAVAPLMAAKDNPIWDVVWMSGEDHAALSHAGMLLPLDYANIPTAKDLYPGTQFPDGVITSFAAVAIVYNKDKVKQVPTSWQDLWNPAYKGHVIVGDLPHSYGMSFLVMMARLNGGSETSIDAGFKKVATLRPSIMGYYKNSAVAAQMFQEGQAWIGPWFHGRAKYMADRGVPLEYVIPKEGAPAYISVAGVAKGTKNKALAEKYIDMVLQAAPQAAWAKIIGAGPANKTVKLDPAVAKTVPYGDAQIKSLVMLDWAALRPQQDSIVKRWQSEISTP